jgi:hypothetical protein
MHRCVVCLTVLAVAACTSTGPSLSVRPGEPLDVTLRVGEAVRIGPAPLFVRFERVSGDSRCPSEVVCIWQGEAEVELAVSFGDSPEAKVTLSTFGSTRHETRVGPYTVTLANVAPYPATPGTIPQDAYVIALRVTADSNGP